MNDFIVNLLVIIGASTIDIVVGIICAKLTGEQIKSSKMHIGLLKKSLNIIIYLQFEMVSRFFTIHGVDIGITTFFCVTYIIVMELISINESLSKCNAGLATLIGIIERSLTNENK